MKTTKIYWFLLAVCMMLSGNVLAQAKKQKLKERFDTNKDVEIEVDTRYADVIFETWNKNEVSVEAYVQGEDADRAIRDWDLSVSGDSDRIRVSSSSGYRGNDTVIHLEDLEDMNINLNLEEIIGSTMNIVEPVLENVVGPVLEGLTGTPLPPEFYEELGKTKFDHEAYRKEGRAYLKRYEKEMEKSFGPEFDKAMEKWEKENDFSGDNFLGGALSSLKDIPRWPFSDDGNMNFNDNEYRKDKQAYVDKLNRKYDTNVKVRQVDAWLEDMEKWGDEFEIDMEKWGEDFELKMVDFEKAMEEWGENFGESIGKAFEDWGEDFGKDMEKWGEEFGRKIEKWAEEHEAEWEERHSEDEHGNKSSSYHFNYDTDDKPSSNVKRTIIIKMPKKAELDLNVRYGKVKMAAVYNPKAMISHGSLAATNIDGGDTSINVSYSPVTIGAWNGGSLETSHVKECTIANARDIALTSNSSNVVINTLSGAGLLTGSFGQLSISNVVDDFGSLSIILENSDLVLNLPNSAFNFNYSGELNEFLVPRQLETQTIKNNKISMVNGFHKSRNTSNVITITAKYSDVVLK
ncbi:DUF4097 domain-containing protein [Dokdonia pacifica]|uniref:Adhesin domain-containing protein n=1 Tax=Dokdonia pacifica TaxID=1627892 RepID=A0A239E287_9FLAO|nr:DUF4097 domain-containing protein [Dokdonia pacifica]SNS38388.1 hypothetical protein SAMN06265376_11346 [Dokdonia pacifica]